MCGVVVFSYTYVSLNFQYRLYFHVSFTSNDIMTIIVFLSPTPKFHKNVLRVYISFDLIMFVVEQIGGRLVLHPTKEGQFPQDPIFLGKSRFLMKALSQGTPNKLVELKKMSKFFDGSISPRENTPQGENARSHVYATSS